VLVLASSTQHYVSYDYHPDVNFQVHLDRQLERIATDATYQDVYGLGFWTAAYTDLEKLRWLMALYRHYGIEGNTTPLSTDSYLLGHLQNPDFEAADGWTLANDSWIGVGEYQWVAEYQARWGAPDPIGDTYLYMTLGSGEGTATQEATGLTPGRTYTLRYFSIWYENLYLLLGASYDYEVDHPVHARIEGATVDPAGEVVVTTDSAYPGPGVFVNQHILRFVPDSDTVRLTLSNQAADGGANGVAGHTYFFNFVQIEPYFEE
jgi:hypothetical protein